jgi:hypothetical protein
LGIFLTREAATGANRSAPGHGDLLESLYALRPARFRDLHFGRVGALHLEREFLAVHPI